MKKGQITLFVILLILIIAIGAVYFSLSYRAGLSREIQLPRGMSDVEKTVQDCVKNTLTDAVTLVGWQGGYYHAPPRNYLGTFTFIPIYWEKERFIPSRSVVEQQISSYIVDFTPECLDFNDPAFSGQIKVDHTKNLTVRTTLLQDSVITSVYLPIQFTQAEQEFRLDRFESEVPYPMTYFLTLAREITDIYAENPGFLCMNCLEDLSQNQQNRTRVMITPYFSGETDSYYRVSIQDSTSTTNSTYRFALVIPRFA